MNTVEAKILHGIYFHREMVGEPMYYSESEIDWLAKVSFQEGRNWQGADGRLQSADSKGDDYLEALSALTARVKRPFMYLEAAGYINWPDKDILRVSVTAMGADTARELDTWHGRANIFYRKQKEGVLWFVATVLVSLLTTLISRAVT